jgi:uncharacterized protein (TIGR03067 family)
MRKILLLLLPIAALGFAPAPVYRGNDLDPAYVLKRLQGTWAMPRYDRNRRTMILASEVYTVKIEKDQWTFFISRNGGSLIKSSTFTLKLDSKAVPAEIDFAQGKTRTFLGVYDLKGDTLKIVFRATKDGRARDLTNPARGDEFLQLERKP